MFSYFPLHVDRAGPCTYSAYQCHKLEYAYVSCTLDIRIRTCTTPTTVPRNSHPPPTVPDRLNRGAFAGGGSCPQSSFQAERHVDVYVYKYHARHVQVRVGRQYVRVHDGCDRVVVCPPPPRAGGGVLNFAVPVHRVNVLHALAAPRRLTRSL